MQRDGVPDIRVQGLTKRYGDVVAVDGLDLEIRTALGLMGVTSLAQLNPEWVRPAHPVRPATQTNAYPWFEEQLRK